LSQSPAIAF